VSDDRLLQPPQIIAVAAPMIFLAGPIQGAADWQTKAYAAIRQHSSVLVANPRRVVVAEDFDHSAQVDWETHMLRAAGECGVVLFWLARQTIETPGRAYGQTSRFELAEWKVRHERDGTRLVVGLETGFGNNRYIERRFRQDCPQVPLTNTLPATITEALRLLG
jgi:hypothetical protein